MDKSAGAEGALRVGACFGRYTIREQLGEGSLRHRHDVARARYV